jgi:hypothetical protein
MNKVPRPTTPDYDTPVNATEPAVVKFFSATAANNGAITLQFANGAKDQAKINGIEVLSQ